MLGVPSVRGLATMATLAALVLAGCGSRSDVEVPPQAADQVVQAKQFRVSESDSEVSKSVEDFYSSWYGNREQMQAAEVVGANFLNGEYSECMGKMGFVVDWRDDIQEATIWPLALPRVLRDPNLRIFSEAVATSPQAQARQLNRKPEGSQEYDTPAFAAAETTCSEQAHSDTAAAFAEHDKLVRPELSLKLDRAWQRAVRDATSKITGTEEDRVRCIRKEGPFPTAAEGTESDYFALLDEIDAQLLKVTPLGKDAPILDLTDPAPEWSAFLAVEDQYLQAAWKCAEPVYSAGLAAMPAVIAEFQSAHSGDIATMQAYWQDIEDQAMKLGWSESNPFAASD